MSKSLVGRAVPLALDPSKTILRILSRPAVTNRFARRFALSRSAIFGGTVGMSGERYGNEKRAFSRYGRKTLLSISYIATDVTTLN